MLKDTKSLGNNKASAWESRGFVIKKRLSQNRIAKVKILQIET
jgi:hypothetical protein